MPRRKSSRRRGAESLPPRAESLGVLGLSGLLNPDYVDPDLDLAELEDSHVGLSGDEGGDSDPPADRPPPSMEQIIATHLDSTLREAGISTSDVFGAEGASAAGATFSAGASATSVTSYGGDDDDDDDDDEYEEYEDDDDEDEDDEYEGAGGAGGAADDIEEILRGLSGPGPSARRSSHRSESRGLDWGPPDPARPAKSSGGWGAGGSDEGSDDEEYDSDEYEDSEYEYDDSAMHDVEDALGFDIAGASRRGDPILPSGGGGGSRNLLGRAIAGESGAPGGHGGGGFRGSAAAEAHLWEQKSQELDFIDHLREVLRRDNVDLDYIRFPTMDSTLGEIKEVSRILTQKSDTIRYSSLAEEGVNAFGKILGAVFNGERRVPIVGWRPDYRGVNQKLHVRAIRLRHQTSRLVGNFVNQYQLGDFTRLAIDFLPTLITYPAENARSRAAAESWDDSGASRIRSNLARSESRRTTAASVADI